MNVELKELHNDQNTTEFMNIPAGDFFIYNDILHLKINCNQGYCYSSGEDVIAGEYEFLPTDIVTQIENIKITYSRRKTDE